MSNVQDKLGSFIIPGKLLGLLGAFHATIGGINVSVDYAIGRFLEIDPEQSHLLTAGMMLGPKCRLLLSLIKRSDHPRKTMLSEVLQRLMADNKRDVIAHGYMFSTPEKISFVERVPHGGFRTKVHQFKITEFENHVISLVNTACAFYELLGVSDRDLHDFAVTAFNLDRKSNKSPGTPDSI